MAQVDMLGRCDLLLPLPTSGNMSGISVVHMLEDSARTFKCSEEG